MLIAPVKWTNNFQFAFLRFFNWPLSIGENISLSANTRQQLGGADAVPRRKYRELLNHKANLEARLRDAEATIEKLSGLRDRFALGNAKLVEALVYAAPIDKSRGEIFIDKGNDCKLGRGQFVLAENSIVGTISDVSLAGARVKLFTNPTSNIAIKMGGTKGFMRGSGGKLARIPMMRHKAEAGTAVMAASMAGFLNTPIIVGKVLRCERNTESAVLWDIIVEPACDIEQLNDVLVIVMNPQN